MSPSLTKSSTPVTVTACATFQFAGVNVRLGGATVPSVRSLLATETTTFATGWLVRTTLNAAVPPASVVVRPAVGVTLMPATSLSGLGTATSGGCTPEKLGPALAAAPRMMLYATSPSFTKSPTPVTVTVRGRFQYAGGNVSDAVEGVPSPGSLLE